MVSILITLSRSVVLGLIPAKNSIISSRMTTNGKRYQPNRTMAISLMTILSVISILNSIPSTSAATFAVPQFNAPPMAASRGGFLKDVLQSNHNSKSSILSNPNSKSDNEICKPTGQIQDACCDYETVEDINQSFFDELASLVKTKYFRYYKVDLYKDCPFWVDNSLCMNRDCTVKKAQEVSYHFTARFQSRLESGMGKQ